MAEIAKPAPEKPPPVVAKPAVVTHVYHYHYHHGMVFQPPHMYLPHYYYQSGPPQISGKPRMEGGAREEMMPPEIKWPDMIFLAPYYDHQYHWRRMEY